MSSEKHPHLKYKICVAGASDTTHCGMDALKNAEDLGKEIAHQGAVLITGAASGIPLWAAMGAKDMGGTAIGMSPAVSEKEHVEIFNLPIDYLDMIVFTGFGFSGRNLLLTRSSDAVIVGCGRIGTVNEFTIAFEDNKPIGVLEGPWSTDEVIKNILEHGHRPNEKIVFDSDPKELVKKVINLVEKDKAESVKYYH